MKIIKYTLGMSNGYFIIGDNVVAVDGGSLLGAEPFLNVCRENGIVPEDITLIAVTHGHIDHIENLGVMRNLTGAPILCHRHAAKFLRYGLLPGGRARGEVGRKIMSGPPPKNPFLPQVDPDLIFEGTLDLSTYGVNAYITQTPGHTRGCASIITADRQAIIGDILVDMHIGAPTLAFLSELPEDECNPVLFQTCEKLLELADTFYSGHGGPFTREEFEKALENAKQEAVS